MTTLNQKEYLKKYLAIGKSHGTKKKRKKTEKALGKRLKIIDDDVDIELSEEIKQDLAEASEEAPQIVEVIDDRPPSLRYDEKTKSKLWVPMVAAEDAFMDERSSELNIKREPSEDISPPRINSDYSPKRTKQNRKREPSADISPPRINSDCSPKRTKQNIKREPSADISPPRINSDCSAKRRKQTIKRESSADISPMRIKTECSPNRTELLPPLRGHSADHSPERRRNNIIGDQSPRRRRKFDADKSQKLRNKNGSDNSPVRSRNVDSEDQSPKRLRNGDFRDPSPKRHPDTDYSPERRRNGSSGYQSSERRNQSQSHKEQSRRSSSRQKTSRWGENSPNYSNSTIEEKERPVCSKKSGLQNAQELNRELDSLREQEREMFAKTATELTGKNAATVCRKKKTTTPEEDLEQQRKQRELEEKYSRWGRGLKQVEDSSEKWAEQLHEMSKPLARYADDEDLEKYLKEQEREGDPMLMYMRKKKKQKAVEAGIPDKPVYMGDFMPNRYGIRPGYRWDGVDRSNGYEQKLFQSKNSEKAAREEALMWNTEDM